MLGDKIDMVEAASADVAGRGGKRNDKNWWLEIWESGVEDFGERLG